MREMSGKDTIFAKLFIQAKRSQSNYGKFTMIVTLTYLKKSFVVIGFISGSCFIVPETLYNK